MSLIELAVHFRALNLYVHQAHNVTKGQSFFEDHSFFASLYEFADDQYDSLIERHIGLGKGQPNLKNIVKTSESLIPVGQDFFKESEKMLREILKGVEENKKESVGTMNLLAGIADEIEVWLYKIGQKTK